MKEITCFFKGKITRTYQLDIPEEVEVFIRVTPFLPDDIYSENAFISSELYDLSQEEGVYLQKVLLADDILHCFLIFTTTFQPLDYDLKERSPEELYLINKHLISSNMSPLTKDVKILSKHSDEYASFASSQDESISPFENDEWIYAERVLSEWTEETEKKLFLPNKIYKKIFKTK